RAFVSRATCSTTNGDHVHGVTGQYQAPHGVVAHADGCRTPTRLHERAELPPLLTGDRQVGPHQRLLRLDQSTDSYTQDLALLGGTNRSVFYVSLRNVSDANRLFGDRSPSVQWLQRDEHAHRRSTRSLLFVSLDVQEEETNGGYGTKECYEESTTNHGLLRKRLSPGRAIEERPLPLQSWC